MYFGHDHLQLRFYEEYKASDEELPNIESAITDDAALNDQTDTINTNTENHEKNKYSDPNIVIPVVLLIVLIFLFILRRRKNNKITSLKKR